MQYLKQNSPKIIVIEYNELAKIDNNMPYSILFCIDTEISYEQLDNFNEELNSNCKEILFFGQNSEQLNDYFDETIEEKGLTDIITSFFNEETFEVVWHYFLNVSGSNVNYLIVIADNEKSFINKYELITHSLY